MGVSLSHSIISHPKHQFRASWPGTLTNRMALSELLHLHQHSVSSSVKLDINTSWIVFMIMLGKCFAQWLTTSKRSGTESLVLRRALSPPPPCRSSNRGRRWLIQAFITVGGKWNQMAWVLSHSGILGFGFYMGKSVCLVSPQNNDLFFIPSGFYKIFFRMQHTLQTNSSMGAFTDFLVRLRKWSKALLTNQMQHC